jgi:hypothetical protein
MIANLLDGMALEEAARVAELSQTAAYEWHSRYEEERDQGFVTGRARAWQIAVVSDFGQTRDIDWRGRLVMVAGQPRRLSATHWRLFTRRCCPCRSHSYPAVSEGPEAAGLGHYPRTHLQSTPGVGWIVFSDRKPSGHRL